jgi:hypothetical protein
MKEYTITLEIIISADTETKAVEEFWRTVDKDHGLLSLDVQPEG